MYIFKNGFDKTAFLNSSHPMAKNYISNLDKICDGYRGSDIKELEFSKLRLFDDTGKRTVYEKDYFDRMRRLTCFAMRTWFYGEKDDIKELENIMWAMCGEYTWALPAHLTGITTTLDVSPYVVDLFSSETAQSLAEAMSLTSEMLSPAVVKRCGEEIFKRVIEPYESQESEKYHLWWQTAHLNWAAVCGGNVGMSAIYMIEDEKRLEKITSRAAAAANCYIESCTADGACLEGIAYWDYAMQYYLSFDALYFKRFGKHIYKDEDKIKSVASFAKKCCLGNGRTISFSDGHQKTKLPFGIMCRINELFGITMPEISYFSQNENYMRLCTALRNAAWFNPELTDAPFAAEDVFLPDGQWAVLFGENGASVALKGGHNDEPHNHNDVGAFLFVKGGEMLAADFGAPEYTKEYFTEKRYSYFSADSRGHCLPIINGCRQSCGREFSADLFEKCADGVKTSFGGAYDKQARLDAAVRTWTFDKAAEVLSVHDEFTFLSDDNTLCERIVTMLDAKIDGDTVKLFCGDKIYGEISFSGFSGKIEISRDEYSKHGSNGDMQKVTVIDYKMQIPGKKAEISILIK